MQKDKKIFITGATGFVGSNLAHKLLKEGCKVKLLARRKRAESAQERINGIFLELCDNKLAEFREIKKNMEVIEGDVTKADSLGIAEKDLKNFPKDVSAVFHSAAFMSFDNTKKEELFRHNVGGTKNVLDFILKMNIPEAHFLSTAYVCGRELEEEIAEETLKRPRIFNNPYEEAKFEAEKIISEYKEKYRIKTNIYRPSIIVGDTKAGRTQNLFGYYTVVRAMHVLREKVIKHLSKNDPRLKPLGVRLDKGKLHLPIRVAWLKERPLNLVPIDYVVEVIFEIFRTGSASGKTFYILNPVPPSVDEVLRYTCEALGISTFRLMALEEFIEKPKTFLERFLLKNVKEYLPYLDIPEPRFKDENTPKVIKDRVKPPVVNSEFIRKLVTYCVQTNWRKKIYLNNEEAEIKDVSI